MRQRRQRRDERRGKAQDSQQGAKARGGAKARARLAIRARTPSLDGPETVHVKPVKSAGDPGLLGRGRMRAASAAISISPSGRAKVAEAQPLEAEPR